MTGIVFAKFTKPTHRAKTVLFSKNALVTMRNGAFYLLCRVADLRPTHLIESHISGYVVRRQVTEEGEVRYVFFSENFLKLDFEYKRYMSVDRFHGNFVVKLFLLFVCSSMCQVRTQFSFFFRKSRITCTRSSSAQT